MSTQTQPAAPGADEPETELGQTHKAPEMPVAWSETGVTMRADLWLPGEDDDELAVETLLYPDTKTPEPERMPWGDAWSAAMVILIVASVATVAILTIWLAHRADVPALPETSVAAPVTSSPDDRIVPPPVAPAPPPPVAAPAPPTVTETVTPAPVAPPVAAVPIPVPVPPMSPDDRYIATLAQYGISSGSGDAHTLHMGHAVCKHLGTGEPRDQIIGEVKQANPALPTIDAARIIVDSAINVYCPQYGG
jgi:hypothetical protein